MERDQAVKFMHDLLKAMVAKKGSDLFITTGFPPAIKLDGKMTPVASQTLTQQHTLDLTRAIMNDKQAQEFEATKECNFAISPGSIGRFRVSAFMQQGRVGMVLRTITTAIPKFEELGLPPVLKDIVMTKRGLIIMVGGTGSGKSTSLAAMVGYRNENSYGHIITIEDPVEYVHEHKNCVITQREVGVDTDSWHAALKNTLRQAPDVILIGQQRQPGARPHHQLLPVGAQATGVDGPLAQHPRAGVAASPPEEGEQGAGGGGRDHAEFAADLGPHLQGRGARDQGDHEEIARARHADLRPAPVRPLRGRAGQLRRRAEERRLGQRTAPDDQAPRQGSQGQGSVDGYRAPEYRLTSDASRRVRYAESNGQNRLPFIRRDSQKGVGGKTGALFLS
jgi:energy-coupling factor transporter ATP-binding protein EcfA2